MKMLKFCMTVDCEGYTMLKQGNPEYGLWGNIKFFINNLIKDFRYNRRGFWVFYDEIKKQKFPCTFMLVGKLFKPVENLNFVEWGYHTYNHLPLNLVSDETVKREVENIYKVKSITCPMWRVEDIKNPARIFNFLKKEGYKNTVYHGKCKGIRTFCKKGIRKPEKRFGINCIYVSNYFEGNWNKNKLSKVKKDILKNLDRDGVYLLTTHDFTHKTIKNLKGIIDVVRQLEEEKKIKVVKLEEIN